MTAKRYSYFDEAYFQDGQKRGTAYVNYKEGARNSPTFREIAASLIEVFQPRRVLEIGCATGTCVRHLNESGCEAHGIDVSEWAIRNAEHPNVKLASADSLPYPDRHFDLVFSCHSLEHLPDDIFDHAISELTRISSGFQFHMLPIVGRPPYDGDPAIVRQQLKKDPTHQQLHELEWWMDQFRRHGHVPLEGCVLYKNDTATAELSSCQFMTKTNSSLNSTPVLLRAVARNQRIFRDICLAGGAQTTDTRLRGTGRLSYRNRIWKDVETRLDNKETIDLTKKTLNLAVIVDGGTCHLRFAAGQDIPGQAYAHVGEFHLEAKPGLNVFRFATNQLQRLRGNPDYSRLNHLALGGENESAEILLPRRSGWHTNPGLVSHECYDDSALSHLLEEVSFKRPSVYLRRGESHGSDVLNGSVMPLLRCQ